jgi:glutamate-1-semialdehyde 2,1-aminomutase
LLSWSFWLVFDSGSGAVTFGSPNGPGVTAGTAKDTLLATYNDLENVKTVMTPIKWKLPL